VDHDDASYTPDHYTCEHPWEALGVAEGTLVCTECATVWDTTNDPTATAEAFGVYVAASSERVDELLERVGSLEQYVFRLTGARPCVACGVMVTGDGIHSEEIGSVCAEDLATVVGFHSTNIEVVSKVAAWAKHRKLHRLTVPAALGQWGLLCCAIPKLPLLFKQRPFPTRRVDLHVTVAAALGLPSRTTVGTSTAALAKPLGMRPPATLEEHAFLFSVIAVVDSWLRSGSPKFTDDRETLLEALATTAHLRTVEHRTQLATRLLELDAKTELDRETVDGYLGSVGERAVELLLSRLGR
jgi:hypothetical protein